MIYIKIIRKELIKVTASYTNIDRLDKWYLKF